MFTGLIEEIGQIKNISSTPDGCVIFVCADFAKKSHSDRIKIGDSIAVNGACQTVTDLFDGNFAIFCMNETARKTNLAALKQGSYVNLERAMKANSRFDGHMVSGHIDGTAQLCEIKNDGAAKVYGFNYETNQIVTKGSVCVNGISLTVSAQANNYFEVSIIPHTLDYTNLKYLKQGDFVNVETDMVAKYIEKFLNKSNNMQSNLNEAFLKEHGF